jgi:regulator of RNase E activity RraB
VALKPIAVGTTFVVTFGEAQVMGIVQTAADGRIFCMMVGPPLCAEWQAEYDSSWVVDDLALRDGSWRVHRVAEAFEPAPLPRFAYTAKDDSPVLMVYAPRTLHVVDVVTVRTDEDRAEWARAPNFIRTDIVTFEHALANTMGLPAPDLTVHPYDVQASEDRLVLAMIREGASDLSRPLSFEHVLVFRDHKKARSAAAEAQTLGYRTRLDTPFFKRATLEITSDALPSYPAVRPEIHRFRAFAERFDAEYDGFGAEVR